MSSGFASNSIRRHHQNSFSVGLVRGSCRVFVLVEVAPAMIVAGANAIVAARGVTVAPAMNVAVCSFIFSSR